MKAMGIKDLRSVVQTNLPEQGKFTDITVGLMFANHDLMKMRSELQDDGYVVTFGGKGNSAFLRIKLPKPESQRHPLPQRRRVFAT